LQEEKNILIRAWLRRIASLFAAIAFAGMPTLKVLQGRGKGAIQGSFREPGVVEDTKNAGG
jgi:hypothetical protein